MRVQARDTGKAWMDGKVTCVKPLRVQLDTELSGCSWDEVQIPKEGAPKAASAGIDAIKQKIMEDAQAMVDAAKEEALTNLKAAMEGVRLLASLESPSPQSFKEAKMRVAAAMKDAIAKGVSKEELIEASVRSGKQKMEGDSDSGGEEGGGGGEERVKKEKKKEVVIEYDNPAVGEAGKEAAQAAKDEGKTIPEIIVAAVTAAKAVEGAGAEDLKKVKKVAAAVAMEGSSSSSDSSDSEAEKEIDAQSKALAKREGIAAVFYFDALKNAPAPSDAAAAQAAPAPQ